MPFATGGPNGPAALANLITIAFVLTQSHIVFMTNNWRQLRARRDTPEETLRHALRWTTVYRIGRIEVQCWVVGGDGRGNLAGVRTVAVET